MCGIAVVVTTVAAGERGCRLPRTHGGLVASSRQAIASRGPSQNGACCVRCGCGGCSPSPSGDGSSAHRTAPAASSEDKSAASKAHVTLAASVLHLRGVTCVPQPITDEANGNILLWNGEVYAGFPPHLCFDYAHDNDTEVVLRMLSTATAAVGGAQAVSGTRPTHLEIGFRVAAAVHPLRGPYSFIFWHSQTQTLCYGRDPSGRRSLLRRVLEARGEKVLLVSSVSFATPTDAPATSGGDRGDHVLDAWTELEPLGVWAVSFDSTEPVSALATQGSLCRWPTLTVSPPALPVELELELELVLSLSESDMVGVDARPRQVRRSAAKRLVVFVNARGRARARGRGRRPS